MQQIIDIATKFQLEGKCTSALDHRSGHIHNTYLLHTGASGIGSKYIMQQLNLHVFPQVHELSNNIWLVTEHIRRKAIGEGIEPSRSAVTLIPTQDGEFVYRDTNGSFWRVYEYIENTCTYEIAQSGDQVYQAGLAMGDFLCLLADFPAADLYETIPNFHHTPSRFEAFQKTLDQDPLGRAKGVKSEIDFVMARQPEMSILVDMLVDGRLPCRVTHNDTKISNVLFDQQTGEAVCMIDLDTVMPGTLLYDFGDAARTMTNTAAEDEPDLSLVDFNLDYFERLVRGFMNGAREILTEQEIALLPFSAKLMTLECGMRFLEDYLNGDIYFHTSRANHNLDRARVQFKLIEEMERKAGIMKDVINSVR